MKDECKILVIDDDPQLLELSKSVLKKAGYEVLGVRTGEEALDVVPMFRPDLVLLDVVLPDIMGTEVCRRLKADPLSKNTLVLLTSGVRISSEHQAHGLNSGADGYITKPISNKELLARVQSMERIKRSEEALQASEARYHLLFETARVGILILGAHSGVVTDANLFLKDMLGYSHEELVEKNIRELDLFDGTEVLDTYFAQLQNGEEGGYLDLTLEAKDGRNIDVEFVGSVYEVDGKRVIQCNMHDVTERKQIENALKKAHDELEERVKERTMQLSKTNELLVQEIAERKATTNALRKSEERLRYLTNRLQKIVEQERVSLAREIHDELGQILTGISIDAARIENLLPRGDKVIQERMKGLLAYVDDAIREVQRISKALRPPVLDNFGLHKAIGSAASDFERRTGIRCEVRRETEKEPETQIGMEVFRILQESLTNIARHSQASMAIITLKMKRNQYIMEVRDNGRGITKRKIMEPRSIGLTGMRERAGSVGGTLRIDGTAKKGTTVTVSIPLYSDRHGGHETPANKHTERIETVWDELRRPEVHAIGAILAGSHGHPGTKAKEADLMDLPCS